MSCYSVSYHYHCNLDLEVHNLDVDEEAATVLFHEEFDDESEDPVAKHSCNEENQHEHKQREQEEDEQIDAKTRSSKKELKGHKTDDEDEDSDQTRGSELYLFSLLAIILYFIISYV